MAFINEETTHEPTQTTLTVLRQDPNGGSTNEPGAIIELEHEGLRRDSLTPVELMELGRWLIEQGQRIESTYDAQGQPKK